MHPKINPVLLTDRRHYHRVEISPYHGRGIKEVVQLRFAAKWQGHPVIVNMECDRYTHSSGLSDWRAYACDARTAPENPGQRGNEVSATARSRLSDACRPLALAWLASAEYAASERIAYFDAIKQTVKEPRIYFDDPTREARGQMEQYADKLPPGGAARLTAICDAIDVASELYNREAP